MGLKPPWSRPGILKGTNRVGPEVAAKMNAQAETKYHMHYFVLR
jgi:hypothetical protein